MTGWTDAALTERGELQVRALVAQLSTTVGFHAIYSSPLTRALRTARPLCTAGLGPVHVCEDLREIHCGDMDGQPIEEVQKLYPELWAANLRQDDDDFRWPGGESYREFRQRCLAAVRNIARQNPGKRVALVTHAGVIGQIVGYLKGVRAAVWESYRPGNASVTELEWNGESGLLVSFNQELDVPSGALLPELQQA